MINRAIYLTLAVLTTIWLIPSTHAHAQQAFARFIPFLVDLDGWQGKKADGVALDMPGNSMVTATRDYQRGPARVHAQILTGLAAKGALAGVQAINIETTDGRINTSPIDGLKVTRTFTFKDKSGAILVALGPEAMFSFSFNGIPDDEALTLAKKFNWKAIQAATQSK
jgi:hypothetical protein